MCVPRWRELAFVPVRRNEPVLLRYDVRPVTKSQSVLLIQMLGPLERVSISPTRLKIETDSIAEM
jgi:hypothetical protein